MKNDCSAIKLKLPVVFPFPRRSHVDAWQAATTSVPRDLLAAQILAARTQGMLAGQTRAFRAVSRPPPH